VPPPQPPLHVVQAPVDRRTHLVLRAATVELVDGERRRQFPPTLHAGVPGRSVRHVDEPELGDAGERADIVLALLRGATRRCERPALWLTRPGELTPHDVDLTWLGACGWAAGALGLPVGLVVVTRRGWFDPVSGTTREWRRLRPRARPT
jgi:hypothetical protein